ncbi:hypothetical protein BJ508DRAFT_325094 [Ascobolus immersus RN42]|uniref:Uncharacterized protein n=1 Tax=Ascobolus immersus RN42 TaxID=1160509 RepID=A0A3N4IA23_ASCIM|nr:hypothetical protein BJ508DRAFT_325094 [Ascobolus immersus RN42]
MSSGLTTYSPNGGPVTVDLSTDHCCAHMNEYNLILYRVTPAVESYPIHKDPDVDLLKADETLVCRFTSYNHVKAFSVVSHIPVNIIGEHHIVELAERMRSGDHLFGITVTEVDSKILDDGRRLSRGRGKFNIVCIDTLMAYEEPAPGVQLSEEEQRRLDRARGLLSGFKADGIFELSSREPGYVNNGNPNRPNKRKGAQDGNDDSGLCKKNDVAASTAKNNNGTGKVANAADNVVPAQAQVHAFRPQFMAELEKARRDMYYAALGYTTFVDAEAQTLNPRDLQDHFLKAEIEKEYGIKIKLGEWEEAGEDIKSEVGEDIKSEVGEDINSEVGEDIKSEDDDGEYRNDLYEEVGLKKEFIDE